MNHQALSLKWRPKNFSDLEGQTPVRQVLINALQSNALHPALIFSGPKGTGKTSCARILAKALLCENKKSAEPCNQCLSCKEIQDGTDMDVNEIDGASHNGVDAIRELKESTQYMPQRGKYKVYIIDEVHMLSQSAFNSLLKTLEEPPAHVVFIMATTELKKIPPTVLSRCQLLHFRHISHSLIKKRLELICKAEKITIDEEALWLIVNQANGSMRDAQVLLDQMACLGNKKIDSKIIIESLGLTRRTLLNDILQAVVERNSQKILKLLSNFENIDSHTFLNLLLMQIRNLILIQTLKEQNSPLIFLTEEEKNFLLKLSQKISFEEAQLLFDMCLKGRQDLNISFDARMTLEMILLRMSQYPSIESLLLRNPDALQKTQNPSQTSSSQTSSPNSTRASSFQSRTFEKQKTDQKNSAPQPAQSSSSTKPHLKKETSSQTSSFQSSFSEKQNLPPEKSTKWQQFLKYVQEKDPRMGAEIKSFSISQINSQKIILSYPESLLFLKEKTTNRTFTTCLHKYLFDFFQTKMECSFTPHKNLSVHTQKIKDKKLQHKKRIEEAKKDSLAQKITHLFQAVEESSPSQTEL